jgi:hypothetical protein
MSNILIWTFCMQERKKAKEEIAEATKEAAKDIAITRADADQRIEEYRDVLQAQVGSLPTCLQAITACGALCCVNTLNQT